MTDVEAIAALDALINYDPEAAHGQADKILLSVVSEEVAAAYARVVERSNWWACA